MNFKRAMSTILAAICIAAAAGCNNAGNNGNSSNGDGSRAMIELDFVCDWNVDGLIKPPNDVVSPYIEERFGIRVNTITNAPQDSSLAQNLAMWTAADSMPDVMAIYNQDLPLVVSTGKVLELTDLIKENMPTYMQLWPESQWKYSALNGIQYGINSIDRPPNPPVDQATDPYDEGQGAHGLFVREDILALCGYTFTPMAEIKASTTDVGIKPTIDQMAIDPPLDSPEAFTDFLRKVQALDLKAPNGQSVIPLTFMYWKVHHFACLFDCGYWRRDSSGNVDGYLGTPEAREYMEWFNMVYQEGLLDADFMVQTHDQYAEKIGSGVAAAGFWGDVDMNAAKAALDATDSNASMRFIAWPKKHADLGWYDITVPGGMMNHIITDNLTTEEAARVLEFWDFLFSQEGQELAAWGPESGGLWELDANGTRKFIDQQIEHDVLNFVRKGNGIDMHGLADSVDRFAPIVANAPMTRNYHYANRSYPVVMNFDNITKNMLGINGINTDGNGALTDGSELISNVSTWWWNEFIGRDVAKLFQAKDQAAFDRAWDEVYSSFDATVDYQACKEAMTRYFEEIESNQ